MFDLATISKAIGGGLSGLVIAELAHFGFQPDAPTKSALAVIVTALVGYLAGHLIVFFSPANKTPIK